jgi:hypothetical protein
MSGYSIFRLILLAILAFGVQSLCTCLPFNASTALAQAKKPSCNQLFAPSEPALVLFSKQEFKSLRKQARGAKNFNVQKDSHVPMIFDHANTRLQELGFQTHLTQIKNEKGRVSLVIELTDFPKNLRIGRIMQRSEERFATRFYIDPFLEIVEDCGAYYDPPQNRIVIDIFRLKGDLNKNNLELLHEIRHAYLFQNSKIHPFNGFIDASSKYRLGKKDFYEDFLNFDELSTYYKDVKVSLTQLRQGQISRSDVLRDLKYLKQIAEMTIRHITLLGATPDFALLEISADDEGLIVSYPIFRGSSRANKQIAAIVVDLPELPVHATDKAIFQTFVERLQALKNLAAENQRFADEQLALLSKSKN